MSEADLNHDELLATFMAEAEEDLAGLEAGLLALEEVPDDAETRRELLRRAHTLKGNASCVGLEDVTAFAHAYEELLQKDAEGELIPELLAGIDTLRRLIAGEALTGADRELVGRAAPQQADARTLRVPVEKLNRMLDLIGEIAIARASSNDETLDQLHAQLQELIVRARMVPVGPFFRRYTRTVRDLAAAHGKNARLVIVGGDVEIDTSAIEMLRDPLAHMIRNAIDHGIEPSSQRVAAGKPAVGCITLEARHEAGSIIVRISDDGAGLDGDAIAARAAALGLDASRLSDAETWRLIFEPGFSTAAAVTDLSGRGIGMDVVRRAVDALRGTIGIGTRAGQGTTFTIRLPLTLAMIDGFAVSAGEETYVVPVECVVECVELPAAERGDEASGVLLLRDEIVPFVRLRRLFALGGPSPARENVLVVQHHGAKAGLAVDALHGASQAVIKPLGRYFDQVPGIAGSSILGNGRVALVLDVPELLTRSAGVSPAGQAASRRHAGAGVDVCEPAGETPAFPLNTTRSAS
jgi:two-component system chemotaxis sensor kinase CheA